MTIEASPGAARSHTGLSGGRPAAIRSRQTAAFSVKECTCIFTLEMQPKVIRIIGVILQLVPCSNWFDPRSMYSPPSVVVQVRPRSFEKNCSLVTDHA